MVGVPIPPKSKNSPYTQPGQSMLEQLMNAGRGMADGFSVGGAVGNALNPTNDKNKKGGGSNLPTFDDYLASMGLNSSSFGVDLPDAPDLTAGVKDQYGGVLDFLRRSMDRTENQGEKSDENLKNIYGAMANMSKQSGKTIAKQGRRSTKQIGKLYDKLDTRRNEDIEKQTGAVTRRLDDLGIDAALPASTERMLKESGQDHRLIARQQGRAESASRTNTQNWANFAKTGAQTARLEGAQQRADLSSQISDTLFALQGQIAQTKSEKAAAMMQAQQAEYGMASEQAQMEQAAAMQRAGMMQEYTSAMQGGSSSATGADAPELEGFDLVSSILRNEARAEPGINQKDAGFALEAMQGIIPGLTPRVNNYNDQQDISQQDFYSQLAAQAEAAGVDPELFRALMSQQVYSQFYGG